ncbi:MAG: hypothetical protein WAV72_04295, partial [Bradyrhizobium sp.]
GPGRRAAEPGRGQAPRSAVQAAQELTRGARPPEGAGSRPDPATQDDFITAGEIERRVNVALDRAIERRDTAMLENLASFVEQTQSVDEAAPGSLLATRARRLAAAHHRVVQPESDGDLGQYVAPVVKRRLGQHHAGAIPIASWKASSHYTEASHSTMTYNDHAGAATYSGLSPAGTHRNGAMGSSFRRAFG